MLPQLVRFGFVGLIGSLINLVSFTILLRILMLHPNVCATAAFVTAVTHNFTVNRLWTFRAGKSVRVSYRAGWCRYVATNLVGFGVNLLVLNVAIAAMGHEYSVAGQVIGIVCGMCFNFLLAKHFVFARPVTVPEESPN